VIVEKQTLVNWRFHLVCALLTVLLLLVCTRIVMLQVIDVEGGYRFLQQQGQARFVRTEPIPANRGMIYDRQGEPIAVSTQVQSIWCNPRIVALNDEHFANLAQALDYDESALLRKLQANRKRQFLYLRRQLPPQAAQRVLDVGVAGVFAENDYKRYYPNGEVTSHLVGFTGRSDQGLEGIELTYNQHLKGIAGARQMIKDRRGDTVSAFKHVRSAQPGGSLQLSIDLRIQYLAYRALKRAVQKANATSGSMVVVDVASGDVLALVNQPSFNPNDRGDFKPDRMRNRAIVDVIEPGSTVKPFTVVAALESGRYTPRTRIDTNPGYIRVGRKILRDHRNYGVLDVTGLITKSSQVAASKIALSLEPEAIRSVFHRLGLGQSTGLGFPGEAVGVLPNRPRWRDIERVTFAFGYGLSVTPLQLVQAYHVLANGGVKKNLRLVMDQPADPGERVIDEDIARQVLAMLKTVTQEGGTAASAAIPAYSFAGKTGTVHKVGKASGVYLEDRYVSLFAGMAPADDPRLVGVVVVHEPQGDYYGGAVAAPVFSQVAGDALRLMGVVPDKLEDYQGHEWLVASKERDDAEG
jgi:cell division protein FtsI (penicillin-binding protein 3)